MKKLLESILEEYRRIDGVALWTDAEKAAARSILRGVAVRAGVYPEFLAALKAPEEEEIAFPPMPREEPQRAFGGFIRF